MMPEPTEAQLAERALEGDAEAFGALIERHQDRVFDIALSLTGSREEAEDLTQSAFLRMYRRLGTFDPKRPFRAWACAVALNLVRNHLRRRRLLRFISLDWGAEDAAPLEPRDPAQDPERDFGRGELRRALDGVLRGLAPALREAFLLYYRHRLSIEETAEALGTSPNAVKIRLFRARKALGQALEPMRREVAGHEKGRRSTA